MRRTYRALLDSGFRSQDIIVVGDSAGANLAPGLVLAASAEGVSAFDGRRHLPGN
uniref:hypothetical protein n=1 Tax=Mycolicibacterium fortuitum TaxID=1766 RepID=UPI00351E9D63